MTDPPYIYQDYRSTHLRGPKKPLVILPHTLSELTGPVFGEDAVSDGDADLTLGHAGEPLGERIVVSGRSSTATGDRSAAPSSRSGRRTQPGATSTGTTSIPRRSTRISPAVAAR